MLPYDFESSVGYWIFAAAHEMTRVLNMQLQAHGITYRQWEVLAWLSFCGQLSQSDLADRLRIEAPTLVGVLDRMERDGWIQRIPSESDRRKKIVLPTPQVAPVWEKMVACARQVRAQATSGLSDDELTQLRDLLTRVRGNLSCEQPEEHPQAGG